MNKKLLSAIIIAALMLASCKTLFTKEGTLLSQAKNDENKQDYHSAVLKAAEAIVIDSKYQDAISFLIDIYPQANSYYKLKIKQSLSENSEFDTIAEYYKYLKDINETVSTLPPVINPETKMVHVFQYTDYKNQLMEARKLAAEGHYQRGLILFSREGRENAKKAAKEFEQTLSLVPGYKNAEDKLLEASESALQVVLFMPFTNNTWNIPNKQFQEILLNTAITGLIENKEVMKFTKISDRSRLKQLYGEKKNTEIAELLKSNIIIEGSIDSAILNGPETSVHRYHRIKKREAGDGNEETQTPYENDLFESFFLRDKNSFYAKVFLYIKSITFEIHISYRAVDIETGMIIKSDTISIYSEDSCEWAEWSGSEEALTGSDKELINNYERSVMSANQITSLAAEEAGKRIAEELASILK